MMAAVPLSAQRLGAAIPLHFLTHISAIVELTSPRIWIPPLFLSLTHTQFDFAAFSFRSPMSLFPVSPVTESDTQWVRLEGISAAPSAPAWQLHQGHPEHMAQDCIQMVLEYLWWWSPHTLSGQPVPILAHCTEKSFLSSAGTLCASASAPCLVSHCSAPPRLWITCTCSFTPISFPNSPADLHQVSIEKE